MLLTFLAIITPFLALVRPLQRNGFFIFYFTIMMLSAYISETYFRVAFLSKQALLLFLVYHLICINISTIFAYGADKKAAKRGEWRIPEADLHILELLGGWTGAYIAQKIFHHKNKKRSYQAMFWFILVLQCLIIYFILKYLRLI